VTCSVTCSSDTTHRPAGGLVVRRDTDSDSGLAARRGFALLSAVEESDRKVFNYSVLLPLPIAAFCLPYGTLNLGFIFNLADESTCPVLCSFVIAQQPISLENFTDSTK
jgi:hypothetical protein